jgi:hypothetical protein
MPYSFYEIGKEPDMMLLRRGDILRWIGVRPIELDKIIRVGLLPWKQVKPNGVRFYRKADVKKVFLEGFKTTPQWKSLRTSEAPVGKQVTKIL